MKRGIDWVHDRLDEFIKPGFTVFDVGAHRGAYTEKSLELVGASGKVFSFELNPDNYKYIAQNIKADNVEMKNVAVSDSDGQVDYYCGVDSFTGNIIGHSTDYTENAVAGQISSIRLDTAYPDLRIDFIKIDVEGAELKVLAGCMGIIKNIKRMLIECHFDKEWPELRAQVMEAGFTCKDLMTGLAITADSKRPFQCLCWRK